MLTEAPELEVLRRDVRALDAATGGGSGKAILIGHLSVAAEKAREPCALEAPDVAEFVARRQTVRILGRIVEAHGRRVVARSLEVAPEVALPAGGETAGPQLLVDAQEDSAIAVARVEDLAGGALPVLRRTLVGGKQQAACSQALRNLDGAALARSAFAQRAGDLDAPGCPRSYTARPYRDDPAKRVRSVADRPWATTTSTPSTTTGSR